jgi:peptide/nickel transport system permease protein
MRAYIIRRLLVLIPTVLLVSMMIFVVMRILPGDIITAMMAASPDESFSEYQRALLLIKLGLDAPLHVQYGRWMGFLPQMDGSFRGIL